MSRNHCAACSMQDNGVKSRIALEHTCGRELGAIMANHEARDIARQIMNYNGMLEQPAPVKKKFFKLTSEARHISGCIFPDLSGAIGWIEGEQDEITEADGEADYTITVIWLTQEEFEAIGEYEA